MLRLLCFLFFVFSLTSCIEWAHDNSKTKKSSPTRTENDDERADSIRIKIANFNAGTGIDCSPVCVAKILIPYDFDIICFNEIPNGNWLQRTGLILGMDYNYVGHVSSANHKSKFKGILSKYKISGTNEYILNSTGWHPASIINGIIEKNSNVFAIYSLQIAGSKGEKDSYAYMIATNIIQRIKDTRAIVAGDFDNAPQDDAMKLFEENGMNNIWNDLDINLDTESSLVNANDAKKGIVDNIFYTAISQSHTPKAGMIDVKPGFSNHKIVWAIIEFPPPRVKKNRL